MCIESSQLAPLSCFYIVANTSVPFHHYWQHNVLWNNTSGRPSSHSNYFPSWCRSQYLTVSKFSRALVLRFPFGVAVPGGVAPGAPPLALGGSLPLDKATASAVLIQGILMGWDSASAVYVLFYTLQGIIPVTCNVYSYSRGKMHTKQIIESLLLSNSQNLNCN